MPIQSRLHRPFGALTTLTNGRHSWSADVDATLGSDDLAPDPHDLLDSALAACTSLTLELYIRRRKLAVTNLRVDISHTESKTEDGKVRYALQRSLHIEGDITPEDRAKLLEIANKCPIHRVLEGEISVATSLAE